MAFYSYNPLTGKYLTSRYHCEKRLTRLRKVVDRARNMNEDFFAALDILRPVTKEVWLDGNGVCIEMDDTSFDVKEGVWRCCDY
jgi:hypothetical protein